MKEQMLLNEVARELNVKAYQISYAISSGSLKEPILRINNKRIFTKRDVSQIQKHFAGKKSAAKKEDNE